MKNKFRLTVQLTMAALVWALAGCATGYHRAGFTGGYKDSKITSDTFQVSFQGNAWISAQKARNYLLYRCAEVTLENGFDYFRILDDKDVSSVQVMGSYGSGVISASTLDKPGYNVMIKCGKGPKPDKDNAFDAREVQQNIRVK